MTDKKKVKTDARNIQAEYTNKKTFFLFKVRKRKEAKNKWNKKIKAKIKKY